MGREGAERGERDGGGKRRGLGFGEQGERTARKPQSGSLLWREGRKSFVFSLYQFQFLVYVSYDYLVCSFSLCNLIFIGWRLVVCFSFILSVLCLLFINLCCINFICLCLCSLLCVSFYVFIYSILCVLVLYILVCVFVIIIFSFMCLYV